MVFLPVSSGEPRGYLPMITSVAIRLQDHAGESWRGRKRVGFFWHNRQKIVIVRAINPIFSGVDVELGVGRVSGVQISSESRRTMPVISRNTNFVHTFKRPEPAKIKTNIFLRAAVGGGRPEGNGEPGLLWLRTPRPPQKALTPAPVVLPSSRHRSAPRGSRGSRRRRYAPHRPAPRRGRGPKRPGRR